MNYFGFFSNFECRFLLGFRACVECKLFVSAHRRWNIAIFETLLLFYRECILKCRGERRKALRPGTGKLHPGSWKPSTFKLSLSELSEVKQLSARKCMYYVEEREANFLVCRFYFDNHAHLYTSDVWLTLTD